LGFEADGVAGGGGEGFCGDEETGAGCQTAVDGVPQGDVRGEETFGAEVAVGCVAARRRLALMADERRAINGMDWRRSEKSNDKFD